jgi:hypothetical protein
MKDKPDLKERRPNRHWAYLRMGWAGRLATSFFLEKDVGIKQSNYNTQII